MPLDQINIRTEEIDEILGKTPNSIIRWGITTIFAVVIIILIGSWFFKYPDVINATVEITSNIPPADVMARSNGKIEALFVADSQYVHRDQKLAIIENPANYHHVFYLKAYIDSIESVMHQKDSLQLADKLTALEVDLGELQAYYAELTSAIVSYTNFLKLDYYNSRIATIETQIKDYNLYYRYTYDQKNTMQSDLDLAQKDFQRYKQLLQSETIADAEFEKAKSRYLNKKYAFESIRTSLANINIQISQLKSQMTDLRLKNREQKEKQQLQVTQAIQNLSAQLDIWDIKYVLRAPMEGICTFTRFWSENQYVSTGETVITIIPDATGRIIGKSIVPIPGSGKVNVGQTVNIKLLSFPYIEYGMVSGKVERISLVPNKDFYYVEISFPGGLKTNYGIDLALSQNMKGTAEIITEDIRLFYRVLRPIKSLIKNRSFKKQENADKS